MSDKRDEFLNAFAARGRAAGLTDRELRELIGPLAKTKALEATAAHQRGALLLLGPPGTGKTLAATRWMLGPLLDLRSWEYESGREQAWYLPRGAAIIWRTAKSLSRVKQYDPKELEVLFNARRLVLDDLGQEYLDKAGFLASLLDEIVTERHRRDMPTALTANLSLKEFEDRYGRRVLDRVAGAGRAVICDGASLRRGAGPTLGIAPAFPERAITNRIAQCEERAAREQRELHDAWMETERARKAAEVPLAQPPTGGAIRMSAEEQQAAKDRIKASLAAWARENA